MMSSCEIAADYKARRDAYAAMGGCGRAAFEAQRFFAETHSLMDATVVRGVLYSPSGGQLVFRAAPPGGVTGPSRDPDALVATLQPHLLHDGCIWRPEEGGVILDPDANAIGYKHYVTLVRTLDGGEARVAVDWSLGQFAEVPADLRLYLPVGALAQQGALQ